MSILLEGLGQHASPFPGHTIPIKTDPLYVRPFLREIPREYPHTLIANLVVAELELKGLRGVLRAVVQYDVERRLVDLAVQEREFNEVVGVQCHEERLKRALVEPGFNDFEFGDHWEAVGEGSQAVSVEGCGIEALEGDGREEVDRAGAAVAQKRVVESL